MSSAAYSNEWALTEDASTAFGRMPNLETLIRLAPQWDVKSLTMGGRPDAGAGFRLEVEFDRSEEAVSFEGTIAEYPPGRGLNVILSSHGCSVQLEIRLIADPTGSRLRFSVAADPPPQVEDLREYDLWGRSLINYLAISLSRFPLTRAWKWFLDRWWLRMTQSGKRIAFFVVVGESFSLVFLIAILVWWKYFSGP